MKDKVILKIENGKFNFVLVFRWYNFMVMYPYGCTKDSECISLVWRYSQAHRHTHSRTRRNTSPTSGSNYVCSRDLSSLGTPWQNRLLLVRLLSTCDFPNRKNDNLPFPHCLKRNSTKCAKSWIYIYYRIGWYCIFISVSCIIDAHHPDLGPL